MAIPTVVQIQSGLATSASIAALNNLSQAQAQTAAAAAITAASLATSSQVSGLNNLSQGQAQTACSNAITAASLATASSVSTLQTSVSGLPSDSVVRAMCADAISGAAGVAIPSLSQIELECENALDAKNLSTTTIAQAVKNLAAGQTPLRTTVTASGASTNGTLLAAPGGGLRNVVVAVLVSCTAAQSTFQLSPSESKEYTALSKGLDKAKAGKAPKGSGKKHYPWEHNPDLAEERWSYLEANRAKLTPSEAKEYSALSTFLDRRKSGKMSKAEQELGGLDPALRDILLDESTGKVAADPLSRMVAQHATGRGGDRASAGPGPSISNIYNNQVVTTTITQEIDARGSDSSSQNIANSGTAAGQQASQVVLTGLSAVLGLQNAGGVLR